MAIKTSQANEITYERMGISINGTDAEISVVHRNTSCKTPPILFLHGFGGTKEDYVDFAYLPELQHVPFIAYDAPGCGQSKLVDDRDLLLLSIPFLVTTAEAILDHFQITTFHLCGHSMGGLTALMLANKHPDQVLSFINIKGNLSPEDCFLSRQVFEYPASDPEAFFDSFIERTLRTPSFSSALYAASLRYKVHASVVAGIFKSMVELSDHGDLMTKFLTLSCPRMFIYGEQNSGLSYLDRLHKEKGVQLAEVEWSGHFPMYSNPPVMWRYIITFLLETEEDAE